MQNKNKKTLAFSLFTAPLLILAMMLLGVTALAEEKEQLVIITLDTEEVFSEPLQYVNSNPEVYANLAAQEEIIETLSPEDQEEATTFSHVPVLTASLTDFEIDNLEKNDLVETIEPEVIHRPELSSTSGVVDAPEAYTLGFDGTGVAVAILDTGVDNDHTFLNVVSEACYSNANGLGGGTTLCPGAATSSTAADSADTDQCTAASGCDHGTHVAGIAAGDGDGAAYTGIARGADIIAIQVFTQFASGCGSEPAPCLGAYTSDIVRGLNRVLTLHNDVGFTTPIASANLSLGGGLYSSQSTCDAANASTKSAIDSLRAVGIASVIASGNEFSSTSISSPGCISTAVAVGSTTDADNVSSFSNSNAMLDLWAPGSSVQSSIIGDGNFGFKSGTSMATPHVAGAWAIIKEKAPDASVDDVLEALQDTGTSVTDSRNSLTFPRIDIDDALNHSNFTLIQVDEVDTQTDETGDTATVQFSLATAPTANVTIPLSLTDTTEGTLSGVTDITITTTSWNTPASNQVTITGVDDVDIDGVEGYQLITGDPTSGDGSYDALGADDVSDVNLFNLDDDSSQEEDFNGNGFSDGFIFKELGDGSTRTFQFNGTASGFTSHSSHNDFWYDWDGIKELGTGDFNGDGYEDVSFLYRLNNGSSRVFVSYGTSTGLSAGVVNEISEFWPQWNVTTAGGTGDFNGDGYHDALLYKRNGDGTTRTFILNGSATGLDSFSSHRSIWWSWNKVAPGGVGDTNGDGYDDVITLVKTGSDTRIYTFMGRSNGLGGQQTVIQDFWPAWEKIKTGGVADFNGDGDEDVMIIMQLGNGTTRLFTLNSTSDGIVGFSNLRDVWWNPGNLKIFSSSDTNGDGFEDIALAFRRPDTKTRIYTFFGGSNGLGGQQITDDFFWPGWASIKGGNPY